MRKVTVDEVAARFDDMLTATEDGPVHIQRDGEDVAVMLAPEHYQALTGGPARIPRPELERLMEASLQKRAKVYRALARWEAENEPPTE